MLSLIYFVLICFSITKTLVYGSVFDKIRPKGKPWDCVLCMGFWVSLIIAGLISQGWVFFFPPIIGWIDVILLGFLGSGTSYLLDNIIDDEGLRIEIKK
jgi:hypothetical protein